MNLSSLKIPNIPIFPNASLAKFTTFQLGGPCKVLVQCQTPEELEAVVFQLLRKNERFILIGGGSNLVVSDKGLDCYVIRYVSDSPIIDRVGNDLIVSGSTSLDALSKFAAEEGLEGLNYTAGIPGTVGGAVVGNAGAFGKQVGDVLRSASLLTLQGKKKEASNAELQFTYRDSLLKKTGDIVLSVRFVLQPGDRERLLKERAEFLAIRHEKHPDLRIYPCAGSFFRNIEPTSKAGKRQATGWFLEQAGGKDLSAGGAKIFDKHANIIVKSDGCTSQNVYELSLKMQGIALKSFNLKLIREVRFVGKFDGMPETITDTIW